MPPLQVATAEYIAKAEAIRPADNNYDGRNYITEMWTTGKPRHGNEPKNM